MRRRHSTTRPSWAGQTLSCLALLALGCTANIEGKGQGSSGGNVGPGGGGQGSGGAATGPGSVPHNCADGATPKPTISARIRRLTRLELANTLGDLLGEATRPLARELEPDTFAIGYSTGDERGVSSNYVDALKSVAERASADLSAAPESQALNASCYADETSSRACVQTFLRELGTRAWRRPVQQVELDGLLTVYAAGRATIIGGTEQATASAGLDYAVRAMLQSPSFVFRTELGAPGAADATVKLTPYEAAATLSYALTASPPDAELLQQAGSDSLQTPEQLSAQGRRLLEARPERFARQAERFVREWLAIDVASPAWNKDGKLYPEASAGFKAAIDHETELFLRDWAAGALLPELLTSTRGFVSKDNALAYGLSLTSDDFAPTTLDASRRAGILTAPSFLGSRAHGDSSSPVLRGLAIMKQLLCLEPPPVPAMVPPLPPADQSVASTTRQRFEQHTSIAFCSACHQVFDPMGMAFEHYDAIGRYRTEENGTPVDSSGALVGTSSSDAPVKDAVELAQVLSTSPDVQACFVRQAYRFSSGRKEGDAEACDMASYTQLFSEKSSNLRELILALVSAPGGLERVPLAPDP